MKEKINDKKLAQLVLISLILIAGIVELIFLIYSKTMRIHHLGFCVLGIIDTFVAFIKSSEYKWCDFTFTIVYFTLLAIGLLLTI